MPQPAAQDSIQVFDRHALEYDQWFDRHAVLYRSELNALELLVPTGEKGIEIGVGTGRFAAPLGIRFGVEPAEHMARMAEARGVTVYRAYGEDLPLEDESFDFVLMVTTVCFLADIPQAFAEARRILRPGGAIILAIIDRESKLGKKYEAGKASNKFYEGAHFHSTDEVTGLLKDTGFGDFAYVQTLIDPEGGIEEEPREGYGQGSFVVIRARKP